MSHTKRNSVTMSPSKKQCRAAAQAPMLHDVFVCLDRNTRCAHAMACSSTCYCANPQLYL